MREPAQLSGDFSLLRAAFDAEHDQRYGQAAPDERLEIVNVRLVVTAARPTPWPSAGCRRNGTPKLRWRTNARRDLFRSDRPVRTRIVWRPSLAAGARIEGPAVIEEPNATTPDPPGDTATVSDAGHLSLM